MSDTERTSLLFGMEENIGAQEGVILEEDMRTRRSLSSTSPNNQQQLDNLAVNVSKFRLEVREFLAWRWRWLVNILVLFYVPVLILVPSKVRTFYCCDSA
jgi:hypothetical protein